MVHGLPLIKDNRDQNQNKLLNRSILMIKAVSYRYAIYLLNQDDLCPMVASLLAGKFVIELNFLFVRSSGLFYFRLNNVVVHYVSGDSNASKVLPIEGSFMSMQYNRLNDHLLISTKAGTKWNSSRHIICQRSEMKTGESDCECVDVLQTFYGTFYFV